MTQVNADNALAIYRVGPVLCCGPTRNVISIIEPPQSLTQPPGSTAAEPGIFAFNRQIVSATDLRYRFGVPESNWKQPGRMIITELNDGARGYWVDDIVDVVEMPTRGWQALPAGLPRGVFKSTLLIKDKILLYAEFDKLAKLQGTGYLKEYIEELYAQHSKTIQSKVSNLNAQNSTSNDSPGNPDRDMSESSAKTTVSISSVTKQGKNTHTLNQTSSTSGSTSNTNVSSVSSDVSSNVVPFKTPSSSNSQKSSVEKIKPTHTSKISTTQNSTSVKENKPDSGIARDSKIASSTQQLHNNKTQPETPPANKNTSPQTTHAADTTDNAKNQQATIPAQKTAHYSRRRTDHAASKNDVTTMPANNTTAQAVTNKNTSIPESKLAHQSTSRSDTSYLQSNNNITTQNPSRHSAAMGNTDELNQGSGWPGVVIILILVMLFMSGGYYYLTMPTSTSQTDNLSHDYSPSPINLPQSDQLSDNIVTEKHDNPSFKNTAPDNTDNTPTPVTDTLAEIKSETTGTGDNKPVNSSQIEKETLADSQHTTAKDNTTDNTETGNTNNKNYKARIEKNANGVTIVLTKPANSAAPPENTRNVTQSNTTEVQTENTTDNKPVTNNKADEIFNKNASPTTSLQSSKQSTTTKQLQYEITHTVVKGDTLWHIAIRYLHDPYRYPELARLSKIKNPDLIYPGNIVRIIYQSE